MTAITKPSVEVTDNEWVLVNDGSCTVQILQGECGIMFADSQPDTSYRVKSVGHFLTTWTSITNNHGGRMWARACSNVRYAEIGVTSFE